jgi:hypothetical protein
MTRTLTILGLALLVGMSVGCKNTGGLCEAKAKPRPDDPSYTIEEQKRRARDKYALPGDDFRLAPATNSDLPGGVGR